MDDQVLHPLPPHEYPLGIKVSGGLCVLLFLISLQDVPLWVVVQTKKLHAKQEFDRGHYHNAGEEYLELLTLIPDNKEMKIMASKAFFQSPHEFDHLRAISVVHNVEFTKNDWSDFSRYVPEEYVDLFEDCEEQA